MRFIKMLFCRHTYVFKRNIYGDEIIEWGWKRSAWQCDKCKKWQGRDALVKGHGIY